MEWDKDFVNKIICGDFLEIVNEIPSESADLVFADPPFNVNKPYNDNRTDYREWCGLWIKECFRVLKPTGTFYLMTMREHIPMKVMYMEKYGIFIDMVIRTNSSVFAGKGKYVSQYQPILVYGKTDNYVFNEKADLVMRHNKIPGKPQYNNGYRSRAGNLWSDISFVSAGAFKHREAILKPGTNSKVHSCQMPIGLASRAILHSSNENDIVLDPFCGSGSTIIACIRNKRRYIGIDIEPKYYTLTRDRIETELMQPMLDF